MKTIILFILTAFMLINSSCHAQYLMRSQQEAYKIQENNERFINKPLDSLLAVIKPQIKLARAEMTSNSPASGYIVFTFTSFSDSELKRRVDKNYSPVKIVVYLKEPFEWESKVGSNADERLAWTKQDEKKYGHLTVIIIRVLDGKK